MQADTLTAETEAEVAEEAKGSSETEDEATAETAGAATTDDVEIPKQQTAEKAADNEAGEGARK
nr:gliding motility protein [Streptomyces sp. NBC_00243]